MEKKQRIKDDIQIEYTSGEVLYTFPYLLSLTLANSPTLNILCTLAWNNITERLPQNCIRPVISREASK